MLKISSKAKAVSIVFLLASMLVLTTLTGLFISPVAATTAITSISPTEGPVGETVRVIGTIDTLGGYYNITWAYANGTKLLLLGDVFLPENVTDVDVNVTVPEAPAGDNWIELWDEYTGTYGSARFTVTTYYYIEAIVPSPPLQLQEGDSVTIRTNVTGGAANTVYSANVTVTDPDDGTYWTGVNLTNTTYTGSGYNDTVYPGIGAHTNYTGTYNIAFNGTLATGSFFVGLTNATEYNRFETVNIKVSGYTPGQNVTIDIKDPGGVSVTGYPKVLNATDGTQTDNWAILKNATLGTYTVTVTNGTGTYPKPIADTQTFKVTGKRVLTVTEIDAPATSVERTIEVVWKFNITYPDNTLYNVTDFEEITVSIYYNTTWVKNITLTTANCDPATATWNATWTIPKNQIVGTGYNFTILADAIKDKDENSGPATTTTSTSFKVTTATLTVTIDKVWPEPGFLYNRTTNAYVNFTITYPDTTKYTADDLETIIVSVNTTDVTYVANITLDADNCVAGVWTAVWDIPWNASITTDYNFTIYASLVEDKYGNSPTADVTSRSFTVATSIITITTINTDQPAYAREETMTIWFTATYADGTTAVTHGSANITITDSEGVTEIRNATYNSANTRFEAKYYISFAAPPGNWTLTLSANALNDTASNLGPTADITKTVTVLKTVIYMLDVKVDVGSVHFIGETAEFYALISFQGRIIDADVSGTLYTPATTKTTITATQIDTGLYKFSYTITSDAQTGTYVLVVTASSVIEADISGKGNGMSTFLLSPTLSGWDAKLVAIDDNVATIKTDVGIIKMNLTDIDAKLDSLDGTVATINSTVGSIQTSIDAIHLKVVAINGTVVTINSTVGEIQVSIDAIHSKVVDIDWETMIATIQTDLGTMQGTVTSIDDDVATIKTDVGTVKADVSDILETGVTADMTPVWIAVVFSILAFIVAIATAYMLRSKLA